MGSEEPSALFFVADGAAKERMQCSETWKNGFELKKKRKYTIKVSQNRVAKVNFRTKTPMNSLQKGCAATVT